MCAATVVYAGRASAYDARVDASFDAQYYSLSSPFGDPYIYRRRYTSTLGLDLDDIQGERTRRGPRLNFRSRLRVDGDFAQDYAERDPASNRYVPGLAQSPLDVMFAYVDGRGFVNGLFNFRLGRQYLIDALGYWSFDGALVEAMLPVHVALSGFLGFEQRTGLPMLAGARFSGDGVWRGDRSGLEQNQYPAFLDDSSLAPARGVALETWGFSRFHSRLSYRRVDNQSPVLVSAFFDPKEPLRFVKTTRTSSERVGYSLRIDAGDVGSLSARATYDLYNRAVSDALVSVDVYAPKNLIVGADVDYYYPTFDADSIFNFFTHRGMTTAVARLSYASKSALSGTASAGLRWYATSGDPQVFGEQQLNDTTSRATAVQRDWIAQGGARYRMGPSTIAFDLNAQSGISGHRVGGDLSTRRTFQGGRVDALAVASLYDWNDPVRPTRSATCFTYVLGA
ncbi:MAG TPA: hypothetical protein VFQ35_10620, partial [Polyangiaceae bacterium]|nr:hypothetical protein [Polyangiaceae bacterium]